MNKSKAIVRQSEALRQQIEERDAQHRSSVAAVEHAKAQLDLAKLRLSYTEIRAPHLWRRDSKERAARGSSCAISGAAGSRQALLPPQNATGNFVKVVQRIPVKILVTRSSRTDALLRPGTNVKATVYVH